MSESSPPHPWRFFRAGGFNQVCLDNGADLLNLSQLDQKLWVALSCPTRGIEFDSTTLDFVDSDRDGIIRANEIIEAARWAGAQLHNPDSLIERRDTLPLAAINESTEEGALMLAAARHALRDADSAAAEISLQDIADARARIAALRFNGDGVMPPSAIEDAALKTAVENIIACCGSQPDLSGEFGITADIAEQFFADAQSWSDWWQRQENDPALDFPDVDTLAAADAWRAIKDKADDYFTRCRLTAYDPRAADPLSRSPEDYQALASQALAETSADIAAFPLAAIGADHSLPLRTGFNPAWRQAMDNLREKIILPLLGDKRAISYPEWEALSEKFATLESWLAQKPQTDSIAAIEALGITHIRAILSGDTPAQIRALIAQDVALKPALDALVSLDKLAHYGRDLHELVNNFVSFRDFYTGKGKATFQIGTLYLDGRSCDLCVRVDDVDKHAQLANLSRVCLAYCECTRNGGTEKIPKEKILIAAAFTKGDSDQLMPGRNGVFYDRQGRDWNATIVRMLEHPISIGQSFWSPYRRVARMIGDQINKFAAAHSQTADEKLAAAATGKPAETKPFDVAKVAGIFAAIGLAIGALGTALAAMMTGLMGLKWWQFPLVILGVMLLISGPAMLIAAIKLHQRNLGPMLDANGWAVNARAKLNIPFGASLTGIARLPKGAGRAMADPYADKKIWPYMLLIAAMVAGAAAWYFL
jgi:hypothetical protein